ncbi:hypothetical protein D3C71_1825440 [compost metagenome]
MGLWTEVRQGFSYGLLHQTLRSAVLASALRRRRKQILLQQKVGSVHNRQGEWYWPPWPERVWFYPWNEKPSTRVRGDGWG